MINRTMLINCQKLILARISDLRVSFRSSWLSNNFLAANTKLSPDQNSDKNLGEVTDLLTESSHNSDNILCGNLCHDLCPKLHGNLNHKLLQNPRHHNSSRVGIGDDMILLRLLLQILTKQPRKKSISAYLGKFSLPSFATNQPTRSAPLTMAGFTLIELLVVIIIIGILAAIALPSFLAQANKARMAEAKSYIGSMNRTQHGYYLQYSQFAPTVDSLGVGLSQGTTHYNYTIVPSGSYPMWKLATNFGQAKAGSLKSYAGVVAMVVTNQVNEVQVRSVMCISGQPVATPVSGDYDVASNLPVCPNQFLLDEAQ